MEKFCGLARNRTWIWSFGNSYTIHCTTRPLKEGCFRLLSPSVILSGIGLFTEILNIGTKNLYRNGEQYYAEKFS